MKQKNVCFSRRNTEERYKPLPRPQLTLPPSPPPKGEAWSLRYPYRLEAPPPSPPQKGGAWSPRYPYRVDIGFLLFLIHIYNGCNALWILYAGGLLWDRNCAPKGSVTSVSSVRENPLQSMQAGLSGEGLGEGPLSYGLEKTIVYLIPMVRMDT